LETSIPRTLGVPLSAIICPLPQLWIRARSGTMLPANNFASIPGDGSASRGVFNSPCSANTLTPEFWVQLDSRRLVSCQ
jgi:hypothetical protein